MSVDQAKRTTTFASLAVPNFRAFWVSQIVSNTGDWFTMIASAILLLRLGGGATELGIASVLKFGPLLVFGLWAGVIVDRVNRRYLLLAVSAANAVPLFVLGIMDAAGSGRIWMVYVTALVSGIFQTIDGPARQSLLRELVPLELLQNAVALTALVRNATRAIGAALAGGVVALAGTAVGFIVDGASFLVACVALLAIRVRAMHQVPPVPRAPRQLRDGVRIAARIPQVRWALAMVAGVAIAGMNFTTTFPLLVEEVFDERNVAAGTAAGALGLMLTGMSAGQVAVGLRLAKLWPTTHRVALGVFLLAASTAVIGLSHDRVVVIASTIAMGAALSLVLVSCSAIVQIFAPDSHRGRIMAMYSVALGGTAPFGNALVASGVNTLGLRTTVLATAAAVAIVGNAGWVAAKGASTT